MVAAKVETQAYTRGRLVNSLLRIEHGQLDHYRAEGLAAAKADPEVLAHFIAWNEKKGRVRDAKVALPAIALRGLQREDADLAENAVAHLLLLPPNDLVRAYEFSKALSAEGLNITGGHRRLLEQGLRLYLKKREEHPKWWDRTALRFRDDLKRLYRITRLLPSPRAKAILFEGKYPKGSVFAHVARLSGLPAGEAAGVILNQNIPFEVAVGSVAKAKDRDILLALLEGMTANQLITSTKMLQRMGVMDDAVLKAAYDAAVERGKKQKKPVEALKAGRAAEAVKGTAAGAKLAGLQAEATKRLGSVDGDWAVLGDCSSSMQETIELARKIAALIAERVSGKVYLVFFNTAPVLIDVTGKTYEEILAATRRLSAHGMTSIGCGVDYLRSRKLPVQGIVIASDGGENSAPFFADAFERYKKELEADPTLYFFHVAGDEDRLTGNCRAVGIQLERFEMGASVDYYSLPNMIPTLRANRYALFDEIMEVPLLTINQVFSNVEVR